MANPHRAVIHREGTHSNVCRTAKSSMAGDKMQGLSASAVVYEIEQVDSDAEMEALLDRLRADRSNAAAVLSELAMNRSVAVRDWVPWAAKRVLGNDAMPILLTLVNDRDPDVADGAVEELLKLDLSEARKLAKTFRKRVRSKYFYQSAAAMWALAAIDDTSAVEVIREVGRKADNAIQRNTAV